MYSIVWPSIALNWMPSVHACQYAVPTPGFKQPVYCCNVRSCLCKYLLAYINTVHSTKTCTRVHYVPCTPNIYVACTRALFVHLHAPASHTQQLVKLLSYSRFFYTGAENQLFLWLQRVHGSRISTKSKYCMFVGSVHLGACRVHRNIHMHRNIHID
jgi:hypothetical protein